MRLQNRIRKQAGGLLLPQLNLYFYSSAVFLLEGNLNNRLASSCSTTTAFESWKAWKLFLTNFLTDAVARAR